MVREKLKNKVEKFRVPGQFEKQACIYLTYPTYGNFMSSDKLDKYTDLPTIQEVQAKIIQNAHQDVRVILIISKIDELHNFISTHRSILKNCRFYYYLIKHCDIWIRDTGMEFLCNKKRQILVDHNFRLWGYLKTKIRGAWRKCDIPNKIPAAVARLQGIPVESFRGYYQAEGGNRTFNGDGVCIANIDVELQRNAPMSVGKIEKFLIKAYHLKKIIWLVAGLKDDSMTNLSTLAMSNSGKKTYSPIGTGGHVDEICRFVDLRTVVLAGLGGDYVKKYGYIPSQIVIDNEAACSLNCNILKRHKIGNKFLKIIRLPLPDVATLDVDENELIYGTIKQVSATPIKKRIKIAPASSYVNFLITNKKVFVPAFSHGCKVPNIRRRLVRTDKMAYSTFKRLFPKHEIIQLNNMAYNVGGGGFNCTYSSQPMLGFKKQQVPKTSVFVE